MKIGILNAYHLEVEPNTYQKDYRPLISNFFSSFIPNHELVEYIVAQGHFPPNVHDCDVWVITGSPASVYDDLPWIKELIAFTQNCHQQKKKILGICFGHQLIAQALGGEVVKSPNGWGIGIREFNMLKPNQWIKNPPQKIKLIFSHQDQVTLLPKDAVKLAGDSFCENQMFSIGQHVFSIQGHPEFTKDFALGRYRAREALYPKEVYQQGLESMNQSANDDLVKQWILSFLTS